jgi:hypothetical protein
MSTARHPPGSVPLDVPRDRVFARSGSPATAAGTTSLHRAAATARDLAGLLDRARDVYLRQSLAGPDPAYVALDQAAAAAHDLSVNIRTALDAIADREVPEAPEEALWSGRRENCPPPSPTPTI